MAVRHASSEIDGAKLREMRKAAGLSITDAAHKIGISLSYLSNIERGQRPTVAPAMFIRICDFFALDDRNDLIRPEATKDVA